MPPDHAARGGSSVVPAGAVYVVEDDAPVRESLALLLRLHGFTVEEFGCAEDYLAAPVRHQDRPACVLIDIRLPGMSGLALQARLARERDVPAMLLMTAQGDAAIARAALLQGAVDFLEKPIDEDDLLAAVAGALLQDVDALAASADRIAAQSRLGALTVQERLIFDRITDGRSDRDIGEELGLSPAAFERRRVAVMDKLQARRLGELLRLRLRASPGEGSWTGR